MCYPKPGPRCSAHAREALVSAKEKFRLSGDASSLMKAREDFNESLDGIDALEAQGDTVMAAHYLNVREKKLARYHEERLAARQRNFTMGEGTGRYDEHEFDQRKAGTNGISSREKLDILRKAINDSDHRWYNKAAYGQLLTELDESLRRSERDKTRRDTERLSVAAYDVAIVRLWARSMGIAVGDRGRISQKVIAQHAKAINVGSKTPEVAECPSYIPYGKEASHD